MKKKLGISVAVLSTMVIIFMAMAMSSSAETYSGACGDSLNWSLDTDTGFLDITGSGDMYNYSYHDTTAPWLAYSTYIKTINFPTGLTKIGDVAFYGCSSLTSITIPDSVTIIGNWAFRDCRELTSITIPKNVTQIVEAVFSGCTNLSVIVVDENNLNYVSCDGVLFNKDKTILIEYPSGKNGVYTIPDGVINIGNWAFSDCTGLTSVMMPNSIISIGDYAFCYSAGLTSITIPDSVTIIGDDAFFDCNILTIYCFKNSIAHKYAENNMINYSLLEKYTIGDVDNDGNITLADAMKAFQYVSGKVTLTETSFSAADIDKNNKVKLNDVIKIFLFVAGKIEKL